jgi:hypothetical protein
VSAWLNIGLMDFIENRDLAKLFSRFLRRLYRSSLAYEVDAASQFVSRALQTQTSLIAAGSSDH